jgi:hypothetical protein
MIAKTMVIVAAMAVMLIGATAFATDSAFADGKKKYGKSQATDQANDCGNGELAMYVSCQNFNSQYQGKKNAVAIDGQQQQVEHDHKDNKDGGHDKDW